MLGVLESTSSGLFRADWSESTLHMDPKPMEMGDAIVGAEQEAGIAARENWARMAEALGLSDLRVGTPSEVDAVRGALNTAQQKAGGEAGMRSLPFFVPFSMNVR